MTAPSPEQPHRYFFVHIMKTAGGSLRRRLINHFGDAAVYPARGLDGTDPVKIMFSIEYLRERLAARGDEIRVIAAHVPLGTAELIDGPLVTLTLLREPVERTTSYLRQRGREIQRQGRHRSLEEVYDELSPGLAHNHMTKMLSLTPAETADGMLTPVEFDDDRLERAKEGLAGIDAVGLQERFEDFCDELSARFGWRLGEPVAVNTTAPADVSGSLRARIAEDNALDIELYEFAKRRLGDGGKPHQAGDRAAAMTADARRPAARPAGPGAHPTSDTGPPHSVLFVRMQKTAGTALCRRLANHFGEAAVYPTKGLDGADPVKLAVSIDHLRERLAARGDEIQVLAGHFPLCTAELIDRRFTTLTLLREPVERTLSLLRFTRELNPATRHASLEELYDTPFRFHGLAHNHMTKMLSLTSAEMTEGMLTRVEFDDDRLERAKQALAAIDAVGLQERFEDFCDELSARFGWGLGEPLTVNTSAPVEVAESFRARIAEDNAFDVELYEFAKRLLAARRPEVVSG